MLNLQTYTCYAQFHWSCEEAYVRSLPGEAPLQDEVHVLIFLYSLNGVHEFSFTKVLQLQMP